MHIVTYTFNQINIPFLKDHTSWYDPFLYQFLSFSLTDPSLIDIRDRSQTHTFCDFDRYFSKRQHLKPIFFY